MKKTVTITEVTTMCVDLAKEHWGVELNVPVSINNRLTRALGRFKHTREINREQKIEFAGILLKDYPLEEIKSVITHELTHYVLFNKGEPYKDGHPHFENELKRVGAGSNYGENVIKARGTYKVIELLCKECGHSIGDAKPRRATNLVEKSMRGCASTRCCSGKIIRGKTKILEYK